jgi:hypothetical protein
VRGRRLAGEVVGITTAKQHWQQCGMYQAATLFWYPMSLPAVILLSLPGCMPLECVAAARCASGTGMMSLLTIAESLCVNVW